MKKINLYWMNDPEWYDYTDDEAAEPFLTEKAPAEAKESFKQYLEQIKEMKANKAS